MDGYGSAVDEKSVSGNKITESVGLVQSSVEVYMNNKTATVDQAFGEFFDRLLQAMEADNDFPLDSTQKQILVTRWEERLKTKTVMEFLKDKGIGATRILSMPDRKVSGITDCSGKSPMRPTLITCHDHNFDNMGTWWAKWLEFMFGNQNSCPKTKEKGGCSKPKENESKKTYSFLDAKSLAKYEKKVQALSTEKNDPELMNVYQNNLNAAVAMQVLHLAIFDAILMRGALSTSSSVGNIDELRKQVCAALIETRDADRLQVLDPYLNMTERTGGGKLADIVTLVEAAKDFPTQLATRYPHFLIVKPHTLETQNSLILVNNNTFKIQDGIMAAGLGVLKEFKPEGELTYKAVTEKNSPFRNFLIASFHSNSEGTATGDVVKKLHEAAGNERLVIGMDANTLWKSPDVTEEDVCRFYIDNKNLGLASVFQDDDLISQTVKADAVEAFERESTFANRQAMCDPWYAALDMTHNGTDKICLRENSATTMKVRSMVNAQPTKGVKRAEMMTSPKLDMNPKDHIVYNPASMRLIRLRRRNHLEIAEYDKTAGMPSVAFPSDHALVEAVLQII
jgi:hypothetical protein